MGKRGRTKKDKYDCLDEDFKSAALSMNEDEIRDKVSHLAFYLEELLQAKEQDQDLKEKGQAYKEAGEIYKEGLKTGRKKIGFYNKVLTDRGKDTTADVGTTITMFVGSEQTTGPISVKDFKNVVDTALSTKRAQS